MDESTGAVFIALLSVFISAMVYLRLNEVDHQVSELRRMRDAEVKQGRNEAVLVVSHHRSASDQRGALVVHNTGKAIANNVVVRIQRTTMPTSFPLIAGNEAMIEKIIPGQRITLDTTTSADDIWPVDVLVTWEDPRGPQSTARSVQR